MPNDKILTQDNQQAENTEIIDLNPYTKPIYCEHHKHFYRGKECVLCKEEERKRLFIENFEKKEDKERKEKYKNTMKNYFENIKSKGIKT
jgi:recombinational DNA repair protein RecR